MDESRIYTKGMTAELPTLPALKHLGDLAGTLPTVVIDSREQWPIPIRRLPTIRGGLYSGDYSISGMENVFAIERKSIPDLVSCCAGSNRERLEHELHRLRGYRFKRLLIIGTQEQIERGDYRSQIKPASVMGSLAAWEIRFDIPVVWAPTPENAAAIVEKWAWYFAREAIEAANGLWRGNR